MRDKRLFVVVIVIAGVALLLAVLGPLALNKDKGRQEHGPAVVTSRTPTAKGVVESSEETVISSQIQGVVSQVFVAAGDTVTKGQLLLEFDMAKIRAQLQQSNASIAAAKARLAEAQTGFRGEDVTMAEQKRQRADAIYRQARDEYDRLQRLLAKDAVTALEVNRAREHLEVAEAQLREADADRTKFRSGQRSEEVGHARASYERAVADRAYVESVMKDYVIHAPIAGVVAERHRVRGESTDIATPLFKLVNPALTRIRAELEETEVGKVRVGQKAEVIADAYPGKNFPGVVTRVFPVVQKKTQKSFDPMASFDINTQEIHVQLQDSSPFKNGMTVTVRFK